MVGLIVGGQIPAFLVGKFPHHMGAIIVDGLLTLVIHEDTVSRRAREKAWCF
jgi:hypothetical protein